MAKIRIDKSAHPDPGRQRDSWMNLNGVWDFSFEKGKYDAKITVPFSWTCPASGIRESGMIEDDPNRTAGDFGKSVGNFGNTVGYYRRRVCYNREGDRLFLIFGAVDYECTVFVNGIEMGSHRGGYDRFEFEVTRVWHDGENQIELFARDEGKEDQLFGKQAYGDVRGIWQTVYLERRPADYIRRFTIRTLTDGTVTVDYEIDGDPYLPVTASFEGITVTGTDGRLVLKMPEPKLWSPESPYLYRGTLTLNGAEKRDCVHTYFGIREVGTGHFGKNDNCYITLNGKPVYLNATLDQSFNPYGFFTLPSDSEAEQEVLRMKAIGLNAARIHIKAEEPLKLYYADLHGLMILCDIPCYWGDPTPKRQAQYEAEMEAQIRRDINHPAIIYWIAFNETWGLLTTPKNPDGSAMTDDKGKPVREYLPATQEWVRACYHRIKGLDPTRLVEDNSPCRHDHVETDVDSWHFYANGYRNVIEGGLRPYIDGNVPGSGHNFIGENRRRDVPLMNSECGNVWGIAGNAGDSDYSWNYKYMVNEFRLHDRMCGFVYTEFHDVVDEFNGYYRLNNDLKQTGYDEYVPGMTLRDLHEQDFLCYDSEPMKTVKPGQTVKLPLLLSSFTDENRGRLAVKTELVQVNAFGRMRTVFSASRKIGNYDFGVTPLFTRSFTMPREDGLCVARLTLLRDGMPLMRNFLCYDVQGERMGAALDLSAFRGEGFVAVQDRMEGKKRNFVGDGMVFVPVDKRKMPGLSRGRGVELVFEASSRMTLARDTKDGAKTLPDPMFGVHVNRGMNPNAFFMTDSEKNPATVTVRLGKGGRRLAVITLPDCPADSRGCYSWHAQPVTHLLDEAGTYGYLSRVLFSEKLWQSLPDEFELAWEVKGGLSLYGRASGRYPVDAEFRAR